MKDMHEACFQGRWHDAPHIEKGGTQHTTHHAMAARAAAWLQRASLMTAQDSTSTDPVHLQVLLAEEVLMGTSTLLRAEKGHLSGLPMLPTTALSASTQTATHTAPSPQPFCRQAASTALSVAAKDCWTAFLAAFGVTT